MEVIQVISSSGLQIGGTRLEIMALQTTICNGRKNNELRVVYEFAFTFVIPTAIGLNKKLWLYFSILFF